MSKAARLKQHKAARSGRPLKSGVPRYQSGEIVKAHRKPAETQEQILATAMAQPHRKPFHDKRSALAGHAAGRMFLTGQLRKHQYDALERYTRLSIRYMTHITGTVPRWPAVWPATARSPQPDEMPTGKASVGVDVEALRKEHADAQWAIRDAGDYSIAANALLRVGVLDNEVLCDASMGALRCALNALAKLWGIEPGTLDKGRELVPS